MRTSDLINQIKAQCPGFALVDHALTSAAEMTFPAAMIVPSQVDAQPDGTFGTGAHTQLVTQTFSIFFLLRRAQDTVDQSGPDLLDDLTDEVRAALIGWEVDPDHTPMNLSGAMLDKYHTGAICWREDYSTETQLRIMR